MATSWRIGVVSAALAGSAIVLTPASRSGISTATARAVRSAPPSRSQPLVAPATAAALSTAARHALDRSPAGLVAVRRPDGSTYLDLQRKFQIGIAARAGPHGPESKCVATEGEARRFFAHAAPAEIEE